MHRLPRVAGDLLRLGHILLPVGGYFLPFSSANLRILISSAGVYLFRLAMMIRYQLHTNVTRNDTFKTPNFGPDFSCLYLAANLHR